MSAEVMTDALSPNEALQSQLSAFIDDELPTAETDLLVRRLVKDQELKRVMARYLLVGEALRSPVSSATNPGVRLSRDFSQRVASALEQDRTGTTGSMTHRNLRAWLKPVAGTAMAASVALAALLSLGARPGGGNPELANQSPEPAIIVAGPSGSPEASDSYIVPTGTSSPSVPIPAARLTNYVVAHSEFASPLGRRNTLTSLLVSDQADASSASSTSEGGDPASVGAVVHK